MTPKELLNQKVKELPSLFFDLEEAKKDLVNLEEKSGFKHYEMFESQAKLDQAKKHIKKTGFLKLASVYFSQFFNCQDSDFKAIKMLLDEKAKMLEKHLGMANLNYLKLLVEMNDSLKPQVKKEPFKRQGLLQVVS